MNTSFLSSAESYATTSQQLWTDKQWAKSIGYSIPARLHYLCETIVNLVILPFSLLKAAWGMTHALFTWNRSSVVWKDSSDAVSLRLHFLYHSLLGAFISPTMAVRNLRPAPGKNPSHGISSYDFYDKASAYMKLSWASWEENKIALSWYYTGPARIAYLFETIINTVKLPFTIIGVTFGSLHALVTWNRKSPIFTQTYQEISKTANRLFLSAFGSAISPAVTHRYRDANITPFIIAARVTIISSGILYAIFKS